MTKKTLDIIDQLVGVTPGSTLDTLRTARPDARINAQKSFDALFAPDEPGAFSLAERYAVAAFVAGLHQQNEIADYYAAGIAANGSSPALVAAVKAEAGRGATKGPYGHFPGDRLKAENVDGLLYEVEGARLNQIGPRLAAAFKQAHLLVFHPRDASAAALQGLIGAGWTSTEIVTLSQLVAFLSFQIRVIVGLRALAA